MKPTIVAAAIIRKADKILVSQRQEGSFDAGKWEFPGGKIEFLEHPEDALIREIREELNITVSVDKLFTINSHVYDRPDGKRHIILLVFLTDYVDGEVEHLEVQDSKWTTIPELNDLDFTAADLPIIKELIEQ